jgi:hypothetical protein
MAILHPAAELERFSGYGFVEAPGQLLLVPASLMLWPLPHDQSVPVFLLCFGYEQCTISTRDLRVLTNDRG